MNTQNILKYYGTRLDLRLDSSEYYDYEIAKTQGDYNEEVLDLTTPIVYSSLKIEDTLDGFQCQKDTITLTEYDNRINDDQYPYSGFSTTLDYNLFVDQISPTHRYEIINKNVYKFTLVDEIHYMQISGYNNEIYIDPGMGEDQEAIIAGFTPNDYNKCSGKLENVTACCGIAPKYGVKPWAYQFIQPEANTCAEPIIRRRTEKGWTLDLVFNRESEAWSNGGKFYYLGTGGSGTDVETGDNMLSFGFTDDGRIRWTATRYSGYCHPDSGYTETFYVDTDVTPQLCTTDENKDFNITITFDRYKEYTDCDIDNKGGSNDLLGWRVNEYEDLIVTAVTSTQISVFDSENEILNQNWLDEKDRRLGILKIYLNGRPIYKKENWEEIIPSNRGPLPFIQSWGGSLQSDINHDGVCCFNIKSIKYYEEPLDFVHVRHNFLTRLEDYDFQICGQVCEDDLISYVTNGLLTENGQNIVTEENNILLY